MMKILLALFSLSLMAACADVKSSYQYHRDWEKTCIRTAAVYLGAVRLRQDGHEFEEVSSHMRAEARTFAAEMDVTPTELIKLHENIVEKVYMLPIHSLMDPQVTQDRALGLYEHCKEF